MKEPVSTVVQLVECWICDQEVMGLNDVVFLSKILLPHCF